jgi:hypothetical protein
MKCKSKLWKCIVDSNMNTNYSQLAYETGVLGRHRYLETFIRGVGNGEPTHISGVRVMVGIQLQIFGYIVPQSRGYG